MNSDAPAYPEMTLRDYVRILFRQQAVILTAVAVVLATVLIGLKLKTPVYEAQVKLLVSAQKQVESPYYRDLSGSGNVGVALTQSQIVQSTPVLERAVRVLKLNERPLDYERHFASPWKAPLIEFNARRSRERFARRSLAEQHAILFQSALEGLRGRVTAEPMRGTNLFVIKVKDYNPVEAAVIANTVSRSYVIFDLEQQLAEMRLKYGEKHVAIQQLKDTIARMSGSLTGGPLPNIEAIGPASVKIVEQATIPLERVGPSEPLIAVFAAFMSLALGIVLAFIFEYLDQTVKSPWDIERYLNVPYLASVPKRSFWNRPLVRNLSGGGPYAEAYRSLTDHLYLQLKDRRAKSLLIASPVPLEGATTVLANLGSFLAGRTNQKVLLVDANLRHPSLHQLFQRPTSHGLAEALEREESWERLVVPIASNLSILPAGQSTANPLTLLGSPRMSLILEQAKTKFGVVLLDCADTRRYTDSAVLARTVDGVVLVVSDGKTRRQVLRAALEPLAQIHTKLLGVILNARHFVIPRFIYDIV